MAVKPCSGRQSRGLEVSQAIVRRVLSSRWATGGDQSVDRRKAGACVQGVTAMAMDPAAVAGVRRQPPRVALATKPSRKTVQVAVHLLAAGEQGAAAYGAPSSLAAQADLESRLPVQVGGRDGPPAVSGRSART